MKAHDAFDALWESGDMKRNDAYDWLCEQMGLDREECHIGKFDKQQCRSVVEICEKPATRDPSGKTGVNTMQYPLPESIGEPDPLAVSGRLGSW